MLRHALYSKWIANQDGKLELHEIKDYPDMSDLERVAADAAGASGDIGPGSSDDPPTTLLQAGAQSASANPQSAAQPKAAAKESAATVYSASEDQAPPRGFSPGDIDGLG